MVNNNYPLPTRTDLELPPRRKSKRQRNHKPQFQCMECGHLFYSIQMAELAAYGNSGCPGCGGSDIDLYTEG